jgi:hypothetical protein
VSARSDIVPKEAVLKESRTSKYLAPDTSLRAVPHVFQLEAVGDLHQIVRPRDQWVLGLDEGILKFQAQDLHRIDRKRLWVFKKGPTGLFTILLSYNNKRLELSARTNKLGVSDELNSSWEIASGALDAKAAASFGVSSETSCESSDVTVAHPRVSSESGSYDSAVIGARDSESSE